jgi:hypothetical protein
VALYFIVCTPISYLVGRERIFDDVTANNSNEYVTIKVDRHVVLAYTKVQEPSHKSYILHGRYKINCARCPISGPLICTTPVALLQHWRF